MPTPPSPADFRFPRNHRLRLQRDFERVYKRGAHAADDLLLINVHPNGLPHPRLGLAVSRKYGSAVRRNRWKRRLREAFRLCRTELPAGYDLVVRPRSSGEAELPVLRRSLAQTCRRAVQRFERGRR